LPFDRFKMVRLERKGDQRIVGDIKTAVYGKVSQEGNFIPTTIERMKGDWVKLSPAAKLENGEYALVEMLGKEGMNLMVWDFGVNPNAGPNAAAWGADVNAAAPAPPEKPKELKSRDSQ